MVPVEPVSGDDLVVIDPDLPARIIRGKADHQRVREGPGFTPGIPDIRDFDTGLFPHFATDGMLDILTGFNESCDNAVLPWGEPGRTGEQDPVAVPHEDNDRR